MRCKLGRRMVVLEENECVVLVNVVLNGKSYGKIPIRYTIPGGLTDEETREAVRENVTRIVAALHAQSEDLFKELGSPDDLKHADYELRISDENNDLSWLERAPETPEELGT